MRYKNIVKGRFVSRPNRFIARVFAEGELQIVHVKNTGRCRELLAENAEVFLEKSDNPKRKTAYDLVAVNKNGRLINMDSQAPNAAVEEFISSGKMLGKTEFLQREKVFGESRFDFYGIRGGKEFFAEVKGVTLEENGVVRFPDAPTERGVKHLNELVNAATMGYECYVVFVVQMADVRYFEPNDDTHRAFGEALRYAANHGVKVLCYECEVTENSMELSKAVEVRL